MSKPVPLTGLWGQVTPFDNLLNAYHKARRGKRSRPEVARFALELEENLFTLQQQLEGGQWSPGAYRHFTLYERKPRLISAAPFADRVVHHAIMNVLEPLLDSRFIDHCYACRKGKGVHAAVDQYQHWSRRYAYAMKLDVRRYFPSINHEVLKGQLASRIGDGPMLEVLGRIIDSHHSGVPGRGMAIGNLTSQFFANLYLDDLDHGLMQSVPAYLRYVDDLVLLADDKETLWLVEGEIEQRLTMLGMALHPEKVQVRRSSEKIDLFGYQISRNRRWLRNDNGYRFARKLKGMAAAFARGEADFADITPRVASWVGHALHGETQGLRREIVSNKVFRRSTLAP
jgi:RNA-directed DNA polymerase